MRTPSSASRGRDILVQSEPYPTAAPPPPPPPSSTSTSLVAAFDRPRTAEPNNHDHHDIIDSHCHDNNNNYNYNYDHTSTLPRLRRRASQGSIRSKPSSIARFLAKRTSPLQVSRDSSSPSSWSRIELRTSSVDARLSGWDAVSQNRSLAEYAASSSSSSSSTTTTTTTTNLPPTPPDDDEGIGWNPRSPVSLFDAYMNPQSHPSPHMHEGPSMDGHSAGSDSLCSPSDRISNGASSSSDGSLGLGNDEMDCEQSLEAWLENGIEATVTSLPAALSSAEPVRIISQMLPYPRATADQTLKLPTQDSVFCSVIHAIHNRLQPGQSPYINVTHAVPEQFSLSNLPSSPTSTPRASTLPRDDYFSPTVFASAAAVPAYHDFRGPIRSPATFSRAPNPIVPPQSVHVSILERYLPPSSVQEYRDLFAPDRPSFLVDRLFELSPHGGSLLFLYPTKKGAATFKTQYLGPILDPLLRQLVVVNGLSADVGRYLGKFSSVSQMDDFDTMRAHLERLCLAMSGPTSCYTVVDAGKGSAYLDRGLWTEWFIHQEKARMKEVLNVHWHSGRRGPGLKGLPVADKDVTSAMLLSEIFEGIQRRPYETEPRDGVELGIFVIRRS
ncbi:hypothetical protein ASPZODRAFT_18523 [Penicilliopsis zonata CBS 506.65]|uniref:Uncharacterized protein n=1 Tax=Penicilliopsis zonata CBS 506.65 TaxID=1073090 RepID=A0A1L9SB30_9EURO|nr:hypothetical protein ASPZODRAFT_18523 [Penicilliopsis zonata CBS 506.65]OJJ44319.1 hypothetical protein ASPZODRAFT_18523 [Penicilliopsis zonata CBS 506.65]